MSLPPPPYLKQQCRIQAFDVEGQFLEQYVYRSGVDLVAVRLSFKITFGITLGMEKRS